MMIRTASLLALAFVLHTAACAADDAAASLRVTSNCQGGPGIWSDLRLSSCNELIKSGKLSGAELGHAYYNRGNTRLMQSEYRKAIDDYTRALELSKTDASALHERCWARAVLNIDLEEALADCNESLRLRPNDAETQGGRGFLYLRLGFFRTAILDYDAAIEARPNEAVYLYGRALAKQKAGDSDGSDTDFLTARALDPKIDDVFSRYDEAGGGKSFWGSIADYWRAMMRWVY